MSQPPNSKPARERGSFSAFRPLLPYVWRYWKAIAFGAVCVLACSYFRSIIPDYLGKGIDWVRHRLITSAELTRFAIYIISLAGLAGCFMFLMRRAIIDASREIEFDFRNDFFAKLQRLDPSFYDGQQTGELMARATNDVEAVRMVVGPGILFLINTCFMFPLVLVRMLAINAGLALWSLLPLLLLPPIVNLLSHALHKRSREVQDQFGRLTTVAQENLAGVRVVKAYVQEAAEIQKFRGENEKLIDSSMSLARLQAVFFPLLHLLAGSGLIVLLFVGGTKVIHKEMPVGDMVAMTILYQMMIWPLIALGWVISLYQRGAAAMERMNQIFEAVPLVDDGQPFRLPLPRIPPNSVQDIQETESGASKEDKAASDLAEDAGAAAASKPSTHSLASLASTPAPSAALPPAALPAAAFASERAAAKRNAKGEILIENLDFTYPGASRPALVGLNIRIPAGGSLGVVGAVGSGKSTLVQLLPRLYPVERGRISVDGRDINDWPLDDLRRAIGFIFQEPFIFSESIAENVAFGGGGGESELLESELSAAAEWAHLHEEIEKFPSRYETQLGERGINLSGGQKQRLALARALVRNPAILVIDDALSAVDTQTEAKILASLRRAAKGRTTIVVSHRLSALSWADSIIVLDQGRIVERGAHDGLLALGGIYAGIHRRQQLEEEVESMDGAAE